MKKLKLVVAGVIFCTAVGFLASPAKAQTGDPVITITAPTSVGVGEQITFNVTVDQPLQVTGRVVWTNPRTGKTNNVSNMYGQTGPDFTYTPTLADSGHTLIFIATVGIPTYPGSHLVRLVSAVAYVKVS